MTVSLTHYLFVSAILFSIGVVGVMVRRNAIVIFMSIELMLNAVNLTFIALSRYLHAPDGQLFVFFVMVVAAAEAVVGLAVIISVFRLRESVDVDRVNLFKW
ncbi:MAG: NADH-quinone oxidoreductase subunit NuoK [bacterium]|jgi:NADH-quinone oxidoreductase subunit K|nr:NADH-quinone oxidoreductase subunit NuoK [bacterium]MCZ6700452.1 NADH-quinone oxidoreductase subunit NuoK [bacterium]MDV2479209.1 NADH-quinone oxidoreductase subunit NuoK [bacterium]